MLCPPSAGLHLTINWPLPSAFSYDDHRCFPPDDKSFWFVQSVRTSAVAVFRQSFSPRVGA
jgi:hypothetical protein